MEFKSSLELLLDNIGSAEAKQGLSRSTPEITRDSYIAQIRGFEQSIKIVSGEANSQLFDQFGLVQAIRESFRCHNWKTFHLIFHKSDDMLTAEEQFKVQNRNLLVLKLEFPDRVHIYWSPIRPRQHYLVVDDGVKAVLEEPNHERGKPFWATIVLNRERATSWAQRFDGFAKYCTELKFEPVGHSTS